MTADAKQVHVVRVAMSRAWKTQAVRCGTLAPEIVDEIRSLSAAWRDAKKSALSLDRLRRRHDLGGLVVWYAVDSKTPPAPTPGPLTIPFEPLELDEGRAPLAELCGATGDEDAATALRSRRWRRGILRFGLPATMLAQLPYAITQIAVHRNLFTIVLWVSTFSLVFLSVFVVWCMADQWLLVPGGVVIRKSIVGKISESLRLYTPTDALIIIRPQPPGRVIELWRDGQARRRRTTVLETVALVAAWQSPLAPPDLSGMSDLAG